MIRTLRRLVHSDRANVAPTVALSLFALLGAGGIAFDYARLASLDTELQNAADQAALAAASQLDGDADACLRAAAAAHDLLTNQTRFANDGDAAGVEVTVQNEGTCDDTGVIRFYQSYDRANDTFGPAATSGLDAKVVLVQVDPREAFYALTPVVGAFGSGDLRAEAVASLGSAICKVPPVMMCNPAEEEGNTDPNLDFNPAGGEGLRLIIGSPDAPGNFGFLRTGEDAGAQEVAKAVGYDNPPSGCIQTTGVETEPGNMISVRAAFNTRFDISENGGMTCPDNGVCSPSINTRKDLVLGTSPPDPGSCHFHSSGWHESDDPYRPTDPVMLPQDGSEDPDIIGYPRDLCHATSIDGECPDGIIGPGVWDIDAFFRVNYGWDHNQWMANAIWANGDFLAATEADVDGVTRYEVYLWEMEDLSRLAGADSTATGDGYASPVCRGAGITPNPPTTADRRRISVAVLNCEALDLKGHEVNVPVLKWLDVFLVEPSIERGTGGNKYTTNGDIYVEVIEEVPSGGTAANSISRRDVPYLIR